MVQNKRSVLFLCTGNSCRSQMAEGLVNTYMGDVWEAYSAGTVPSGYVHPLAVEVMAELGIDLSNNRSKSAAELMDNRFEVVVTVCDDAAENCPLWLREGEVVHIGFPDPAKATGTLEERLTMTRGVRDAIRADVLTFLESKPLPATAAVAGDSA